MLTLLELLCLLFLIPITNYVTLTTAATTSSTDPCREARSLEPLITVGLIDGAAGFCPMTTSGSGNQCCSANAWTTLFPQSWTRLANPFNTKLVSMESGLRKGIEDVKEMNCPSESPLQATTLTALSQLATNKWIQLLNSTTSPECRLKVVQSIICPGVCEPNMSFQLPCRNLCLNILRGCVGDLARLSVPWKHVMNSVRTAVRLLATTVNSGCRNPSAVDTFIHALSSWREPLLWLDNGCDELPQDNCFNGRDVSSYMRGVSPLGSSSNPEFPFSELPPGGTMKPEVQEFKTLLDSVTESLSHHWPKLPDETESSSDQLLSDELGSGQGDGTGGRRFFNTDDEDLLDSSEFGSGSGDGEGEEGDFGKFPIESESERDDLVEESNESTRVPHHIPSPTPPQVTTTTTETTKSVTPSSSSPMGLNNLIFVFGAIVLSFIYSHRTLHLCS